MSKGGSGWISAFSEQLNQIKDVITTDAYVKEEDEDNDFDEQDKQNYDDEAVMLRTETLMLKDQIKDLEKRLLEFEEREVNISREFRVILTEKEQEITKMKVIIENLKSEASTSKLLLVDTSENGNGRIDDSSAIDSNGHVHKLNQHENDIIELQKLHEEKYQNIKESYERLKETNEKLLLEKDQQNVIINNLKQTITEGNNSNSNDKSQKELSRLRQHLMDIEEQHTIADLENQEKVDKLNEEIRQLTLIKEQNKAAKEQLVSLQKELIEKQEVIRENTEELKKSNTTLINLNNCLEQFQAEQELTIKRELVGLNQKLELSNKELVNVQNQLLEMSQFQQKYYTNLETIKQLEFQVESKILDYKKLQSDIEPLKAAFDKNILRLGDMCLQEQESVDKRVVSKLFLTYLSKGSSASKKTEILELISKILNFSESEKTMIGLKKQQWSLLPNFLGGGSENPSSDATEKPITEMWIEFLLKEASSNEESNNNNNNNNNNSTPISTPVKSIPGATTSTSLPSTPMKSNISSPPIPMQPIINNSYYSVTPKSSGTKAKTTIIYDGDIDDTPFK
ncbi:hypothetical protein DLAC_02856 [Tieghemostelium lacteum]|uniref:GRIP domain-containing protein n=1 Tax=Tieghemostelium lacteum TaxID=361077 RepID=A0A152A3G6_TIELA|nr:hypothetical protein DLAC_02856 [Tieghemostelium lacteum]|eukprot:KYR00803.1 hypothetical protein DLAC_02856 [Tieghemostelium lacteum]